MLNINIAEQQCCLKEKGPPTKRNTDHRVMATTRRRAMIRRGVEAVGVMEREIDIVDVEVPLLRRRRHRPATAADEDTKRSGDVIVNGIFQNDPDNDAKTRLSVSR